MKVSELTGNISIYCKEELKISKEDYETIKKYKSDNNTRFSSLMN